MRGVASSLSSSSEERTSVSGIDRRDATSAWGQAKPEEEDMEVEVAIVAVEKGAYEEKLGARMLPVVAVLEVVMEERKPGGEEDRIEEDDGGTTAIVAPSMIDSSASDFSSEEVSISIRL